MSLSSAVHDEAVYRNAANRSLLFLLRLFEFPRFAVHTPEGAKRIAASQGGGEYFCGRGPGLATGKESATRQGKEVFRAELASAGRQEIFQLGVAANRNLSGAEKLT